MPAGNVTVTATYKTAPVATTYTVTVNNSSATTTGAGSYEAGKTVTVYAGTRSSYTFNGWTVYSGGETLANSATATFTMPANAVTITANWTYNGGSGSDSDSSSSSVNTHQSILPYTTYWINSTTLAQLKKTAEDNNLSYVLSRTSGKAGIRANVIPEAKGYSFWHDTVTDKAVQVRVYISKPEQVEKDLMLSGYVKGSAVDKVRALFEKFFKNKIRTIHLDQIEDWGQPVQIAAKIDFTDVNTSNLCFYSYNSKTNTYRRIEKPAYWVDANGYLRFTTEYADDIIISEGTLERK